MSVVNGLLLLAACGGGDTAGPSGDNSFTVELANTAATVIVGGRTQLAATVRNDAGQVVTATISWTSSNTLSVTVSNNGTVAGLAPGQSLVTARVGTAKAEATITVPALPLTGTAVPELASFDQIIPALMLKWGIPGGAVAVVKDGRLIYARGYGYSDLETATPTAADALFRLASISKPITAAAALKLEEEGRLDLDTPAFSFRPDLTEPPGTARDSRINGITVRQLLWHVGGWDRDVSGDPMFNPVGIAQALGVPPPAGCEGVMRFMLGRPLDFAPGTKFAYSNFGYCVLGRVIEKVAGEPYNDYVQEKILTPLGITRMRIGASNREGRAPGEVTYYDRDSTTSVFGGGGIVPSPYGGFFLESFDALGAWIASAPDLLKFMTAVDGFSTRPDILRPETISLMLTTAPGVWGASPYYYAMGWLRRPAQDNWWHDGSLPGTTTLLVRAGNGLAWAALFNARSMKPNSLFAAELDPALWQAVGEVTSWPSGDQFQ
ncbi:MAG TPA: serine hydrolase [Gemmatimonadales bacterium]|nr:serine hydrolase [Gemmatimonadales bacterium]